MSMSGRKMMMYVRGKRVKVFFPRLLRCMGSKGIEPLILNIGTT